MSEAGLRSRLSSSRIVQRWEEGAWNRRMDRRLVVEPPPGMFPKPQEPHLLVIPHYGPGHESFRPGTRNFYFEAAQVARERFSDVRVSVLGVEADEGLSWQDEVIEFCATERVTHVLAHTEVDPGHEAGPWNWDILWTRLSASSDIVLLGVLFDSAFRWITAGSRRLARISPSFVLVDICMPMDGVLVRGRPEVGPVNMPMSRESFALIDEHVAGLSKVHDVSFIGALYPYRVDMIEALRSEGLSVAVNPHRPDATHDFAASRTNQPSFLDYMAGLAQSEITVNFSRSSAGPYEQLKTRVIEASSVGCLVLTDDRDRTRRFWAAGEFATFDSLRDVPSIARSLLADRGALQSAQQAARTTARRLAAEDFWTGIERILEVRQLPRLRASHR